MRSADVAGNVVGSQPPTASVSPQAGGGGSFEVNCVPCGGCCGNRRGRRLPGRVYGLVAWVAGVRGVPMCQVVNEFPELFCGRVGRRVGVKARERDLSRAVQFKASYLLGVVKHAGDVGEVVEHLRLAFEDYLGYRGGGDVDGFINGLLRELGFASLRDLALYLWWLLPSEVYGIMVGLVDFVEATRRGWVNIIKLRCRLRHGEGDVTEIPTTVDLPTFIRLVVRHFRYVHGLATWRDVAKAVLEARRSREPEGDDVGVRLLRHSAAQLQLDRLIAHRLVDVKLLERIGKEYRCRVCNANVGGVIEAIDHVLNHHYDAVNGLIGGVRISLAEAAWELAVSINPGNPEAVRRVIKPLAQGILDYVTSRGVARVVEVADWLKSNDEYRPLAEALGLEPEKLVTTIAEALAKHRLLQINGELLKAQTV
ncbi:MAG: hypothetical protein RXQ94_04955 [Caldivirga sp.]